MLFKIIGGCIVVLTSFLIGNNKAKGYKERIDYLESFLLCVIKLEDEISFTKTPIAQAFKNISEDAHPDIKKIFNSAFNKAQGFTGELIRDIWQKAVIENFDTLFTQDRELIISFSNCFSESDTDGQMKHFAMYRNKISQELSNAKDICTNNMKLYKSLGLYCGILITVLFL